MQCHSCPHSAAIRRGDFNSKPWNELPCATCKLGEDTFFSIPLDEEHPPASAIGSQVSAPSDSVPASAVEQMVFGTLVEFFDSLLSLPSEQRDIVAWRFQGLTYWQIADLQGTSSQLAEMRHKLALKKCPVLKKLFPEKIAKRRRRLSRR
jgi:hypothetical protein